MSNFRQFMPVMVHKFELFTANGTWTFPTKIIQDSSGNAEITVTAIAGGGSGSRRIDNTSVATTVAFGGMSGEYVCDMPMQVSGNLSITIGSGGSGTVSTTQGQTDLDGVDGGDTVIGSFTLKGGEGGQQSLDFSSAWNIQIEGMETRGGINFTQPGMPTLDTGGATGELAETPDHARGGRGGPQNPYTGEDYSMSGGGGGLVLDTSHTKAGNAIWNGNFNYQRCGLGGYGYGAGGGASTQNTGSPQNHRAGSGAAGAVLIEWWEYA